MPSATLVPALVPAPVVLTVAPTPQAAWMASRIGGQAIGRVAARILQNGLLLHHTVDAVRLEHIADAEAVIEVAEAAPDHILGGLAVALQSVGKSEARRPVAVIVNLILCLPAQAVGERQVRLVLPVILVEQRSVNQVGRGLGAACNVDQLRCAAAPARTFDLRKRFAQSLTLYRGRVALGCSVGRAARSTRTKARVGAAVDGAAAGGAVGVRRR